ncbi:MAG: serine hydrolase [Bacteroidales bacterium]|nr:serine hydrolase [Bacteroidales bacterium]
MRFILSRFFIVSFTIFLLFPTKGISQVLSGTSGEGEKCNQWVDSVYQHMTDEQRIAQLLMIRVNSTIDSIEIRQVANWIRSYNLGGICFFKGGPVRQAILTNYYQSLAITPLLVSMDAEWGLGMRLDSTMSFARQMTLGAMPDDAVMEQYGVEIAAQLHRMGVHISFSPVADINNNPNNPVINVRSFGEDKNLVARRAISYMKGLQKGGVQSVAKHFPGHGDTDTDSHLALPFIDHTAITIDTLDLFPFKKLIQAGVDGIMVAHLFIPALDTSVNLPSSLSPVIVKDLLRDKLGFKGLIYTDALDMKGAAQFAPPGKLEVRAILAGNDVLLLPEQIDSVIANIKMALDSGIIAPSILADRCKRILEQKYRLGLISPQRVKVDNLVQDLNSPASVYFNSSLYAEALTLLKNEGGLLPLSMPDTLKIASVTIGYRSETLFDKRLSSYGPVDHFNISKDLTKEQAFKILPELEKYNLLIVSVNNTHPSPARQFGFTATTIALVDTLIKKYPSILNLFSLPYSLQAFNNAEMAKAIIISYQDNVYSYDMAAQMIFGGIASKGRSPVTISDEYPLGSGIASTPANRLKFTMPEELGITTASMAAVDSIVMEGIRKKAYPGCQVLVAKEGKIIYSKSFGYHDYSEKQEVVDSDLYDLASITKVASTTLAVMKLHDDGLIDPRKPLSRYLPFIERSNKNKITIKEVMTHQAGLQAWIPFYKQTLVNGGPDTLLYSKTMDDTHPVRVAENLYIQGNYPSKMVDSIVHSPLLAKKVYVYSDLGFILLQKTVERLAGSTLDQFMDSRFYKPMGLPTMGYLPRTHHSLNSIIPTENDTLFRKQLIHGDVHDPAAAMMGGVAGHAGLFGNATDLAAIFQMLLQNGKYGGRTYLDSATIAEFTGKQFANNRRGLGFDKPQPPGEEGPACRDASPRSFGHTGFTGTYVWADPDEQLIIVFLSNRVNPDAEDNKLVKLGIRTRIQQAVYNSIKQSYKSQINN